MTDEQRVGLGFGLFYGSMGVMLLSFVVSPIMLVPGLALMAFALRLVF